MTARTGPRMVARLSRADDEAGILAVYTAAFDRWPVAELTVPLLDHLRWKLCSHERALHFVGEIAGEIVVTRPHVVRRIKVGERVLLSQAGVDNATLPRYQGLGLMAELRDFGWDVLGAFDMAYFVESGHPRMQALQPKVPVPLERFANTVDVLVHDLRDAATAYDSPRFELRSAERFDERTDLFWSEASRPFDFIVVRDSEYLNWRFDPRAGTYHIRLATEGGRVLGYTVTATAYGRGYIADLLVLPARPDVLEALLRDALDRLRAAGVSSVKAWLPRRHAYRGVFERFGFRPRGPAVAFAFESHRASAEELRFLHEPRLTMHVSLSDSDVV